MVFINIMHNAHYLCLYDTVKIYNIMVFIDTLINKFNVTEISCKKMTISFNLFIL